MKVALENEASNEGVSLQFALLERIHALNTHLRIWQNKYMWAFSWLSLLLDFLCYQDDIRTLQT